MQVKIKSVLPDNSNEDTVIDTILKNRNIHNSPDFFAPPHPTALSLKDFGFSQDYIESAMEYIWPLRESKRKVIIYSDYDADGVTGGAILWETLHILGFDVMPYIGNRIDEGYGFSKAGLNNVKEKYNPALIISVDHGIAGKDMVKFAKDELQIPIIVTDHHHKQVDKVPDEAVAVFHIPALSGSGTAYYVAKEIVDFAKKKGIVIAEDLFLNDYVGLAAIGTIADLVPLVGPSRAIAKYGLDALTKTSRAGILSLKSVSGNLGKNITTYEVGFMMAPRINASGRLADALSALRLLCTKDKKKADEIAQNLQALNSQRQDMVKKAVMEATAMVELVKSENVTMPKILILHQSNTSQYWHEGIIGLIASKMVEKYHRPTIVFTKSDTGYKASARSIAGFHLTDFLKDLSEHLDHFGGHAAAAGLSLSENNLQKFVDEATALANKQISDLMLIQVISVDCEIEIGNASISLAKKVESLSPFGMGNEKPKFVSRGKVTSTQIFGKDKSHLRFRLISGSESLEFVAFGKAEKADDLNIGNEVSVAYSLDINHWNGTEKLQAKYITHSPV